MFENDEIFGMLLVQFDETNIELSKIIRKNNMFQNLVNAANLTSRLISGISYKCFKLKYIYSCQSILVTVVFLRLCMGCCLLFCSIHISEKNLF